MPTDIFKPDLTVFDPAEYRRRRLDYWRENAGFWPRFIDNNFTRRNLFTRLIDDLTTWFDEGQPPQRVIDLGCGEGLFLRLCHQAFRHSELIGLDYCTEMLAVAEDRSPIPIHFFEGDIESPEIPVTEAGDIVAANLVLVETHDLNQPFSHMRRLLSKNGLAVVMLLDPVVEMSRFFGGSKALDRDGCWLLGDDLLVSSPIKSKNSRSPQPYFRIIRTLADHIEAALSAGLALRHVVFMDDRYVQRGARFVLLYFRHAT